MPLLPHIPGSGTNATRPSQRTASQPYQPARPAPGPAPTTLRSPSPVSPPKLPTLRCSAMESVARCYGSLRSSAAQRSRSSLAHGGQASGAVATPEHLKQESLIAYTSGRFAEALDKLTLALRKSPRDASLLCLRSATNLSLHRVDEALRDGLDAVALEPSSAKAYYRLGRVLFEMGRFEDGVRAFQVSHMLDPSNSDYRAFFERLLEYTPHPAAGLSAGSSESFGHVVLPFPVDPIEVRFLVNVHADSTLLTTDDVLRGIEVDAGDPRLLRICREVDSVEIVQRIPLLSSSRELPFACPLRDPACRRPEAQAQLDDLPHVRVDILLGGRRKGLLALYWLWDGKFIGWHVEWSKFESMSWLVSPGRMAQLRMDCLAQMQTYLSGSVLGVELPFACEAPRTAMDFSSIVRLQHAGTSLTVNAHMVRSICVIRSHGADKRLFQPAAAPFFQRPENAPYLHIRNDFDRTFCFDHLNLRRAAMKLPVFGSEFQPFGVADTQTEISRLRPAEQLAKSVSVPYVSSASSFFTDFASLAAAYPSSALCTLPGVSDPAAMEDCSTGSEHQRISDDQRRQRHEHPKMDELLLIAVHCGDEGVFCCTYDGNGTFLGSRC